MIETERLLLRENNMVRLEKINADNNYNLWRLMIDQQYQHRGYGRKAVELALEFIRTFPCGEAEYCWLSYEPENDVARRLYGSFGFEETGDMDGDEVIAVLKL